MGRDCQISKSAALAARDCSHLKCVAWPVEALCRLLSECVLEVLDKWVFFRRFDAFDGKGCFPIATSSARAIATTEPLRPEVMETSGVAPF